MPTLEQCSANEERFAVLYVGESENVQETALEPTH